MQKIADLDLYAFFKLFNIIKEKFPNHSVSLQSHDRFVYICITASDDDAYDNSIEVMIYDPLLYIEDSGMKTDADTIKLEMQIGYWKTFVMTIKLTDLDNELFMSELTSVIGKHCCKFMVDGIPYTLGDPLVIQKVCVEFYEIIDATKLKDYYISLEEEID